MSSPTPFLRKSWRALATSRIRAAAVAATTGSLDVSVRRDVGFGRSLRLVGSDAALGRWDPGHGAEMGWSEGNLWRVSVPADALQGAGALEFKLVVVDGEGRACEWEPGSNHVVAEPGAVTIEWGRGGGAAGSSGSTGSHVAPGGEAEGPHRAWAGKEPSFVRSNQFAREREGGRWDTRGLSGAALAIVSGDKDAGSWLQKLGVAERLLVEDASRRRPGLEAVAAAYVYLQWGGSGTLPGVEGGGHSRPNRHAELARSIFRSLEWVIEEQGRAGAGAGIADAAPEREALLLLARRLASRVPSFDAAYTASTPLTRIRDIAHRNDIPHELKQEIKHTLQNKLHRNAGPEDLVATRAMLDRVTRHPGEYSQGFVDEFRVFYRELADFFSAGSLTDSLSVVREGLEDDADRQVGQREGWTDMGGCARSRIGFGLR